MVITDTGRVTSSTSPSRSTAASLSPRSGASAALAASFRSLILRTPRRRWEQDKRCDIACVISIGFVAHLAIACDCKRSHAIACDRMRSRKNTFLSRLSEFLKMHREREAGQKVCLKCFFTTTGRNTSGTCFGETGLKIRPDVLFHHNNCEQKKHVLLCKMSPASHFFLFEKGENNGVDYMSTRRIGMFFRY